MYQKPVLQKFGAFRDLTRIGFTGVSDGASVLGPNSGRKKRRQRPITGGNSVATSS